MQDPAAPCARKRVLLLGATGTIGRATAAALTGRGHEVVCFVRPRAGVGGSADRGPRKAARRRIRPLRRRRRPRLARRRFSRRAFRRARLLPRLAHRRADGRLGDRPSGECECAGVLRGRRASAQFELLSALSACRGRCLAFQHAKLAFEKALIPLEPYLFHLPANRLLQVALGPGRARAAGETVRRLRRRRLTPWKPISDRRSRKFPCRLPRPPSRWNRVCRSAVPARRSRRSTRVSGCSRSSGSNAAVRRVPVALLDVHHCRPRRSRAGVARSWPQRRNSPASAATMRRN